MERKRGLIIVNPFHRTKDYLYQPRRLKEEFLKLGVEADVVRNDEFLVAVENGGLKGRLAGVDFVVYLDKDRYVLKGIEELGIPVYDRYEAIATCDDKMLTFLALSGHGIRMPKTLPGPLCYLKNRKISLRMMRRIEKELPYPLIVKECYGSLGKAVYLIKNREQLLKRLETLKMKAYLLQEDIGTSYGRDVRVIVIGGEVAGAMLRTARKGFRSNVARGGKAEPYAMSDALKEESLKIARILRLDYAGLDFLFGPDGFILSEVNSNAFYRAFEAVTGTNVAGKYARYILDTLEGRKSRP